MSPADRQLDYMAGQLTKLEENMIDPREFGRLEGAVAALKSELDSVKAEQAETNRKDAESAEKYAEKARK